MTGAKHGRLNFIEMQNKYSIPGRPPSVRAAVGVVLTLVCPLGLGAWTRASHGGLAAAAAKAAPAFEAYASSHGLVPYVVQAVQDADNESEKVFTADLEKAHPGIRMIKGDDPTKVQHTSPVLAYFLPEDTRMHNAIECLKIARQLRKAAGTEAEHRAAMRIFGDGLHLVQDYFAHLNAPGRGSTGFSHGVGNLIDLNGDGTPETPAGRVVDDVLWDCHSDHGNDLVPAHLRVINYFYSPFWHRYPAKEQTWRYQAALQAGIEYMECYLAEEGVARFTQVLAKGYVEHGGVRTYLDLITHIAADNADKTCQLSGEWRVASPPGCFMADSAIATVQDASTKATWSLEIPLTGRYDLYLRWPQEMKLTSRAEVTVGPAGKSPAQTVNQQTHANRWNLLGRFASKQGENLTVTLCGPRGELIAADAVLLVRVPE